MLPNFLTRPQRPLVRLENAAFVPVHGITTVLDQRAKGRSKGRGFLAALTAMRARYR